MLKKKKQAFLKFFKSNYSNISESCKSVNISRQIYYDWMQYDLVFRNEVELYHESTIDLAEEILIEKMQNGVKWALDFGLKTRGAKWVKTIINK